MSFGSPRWRLFCMLLLTTLFFVVEIVVGYITNSMALVADSFHMFSDVIALIIAYFSVKMSPKRWSKNTFGWARAEVLGALVNAVFLCALCFSILIESIKRFVKPEQIHDPPLILVVGSLGLFINLIGLLMFKDSGHPHHHHHHHKADHDKLPSSTIYTSGIDDIHRSSQELCQDGKEDVELREPQKCGNASNDDAIGLGSIIINNNNSRQGKLNILTNAGDEEEDSANKPFTDSNEADSRGQQKGIGYQKVENDSLSGNRAKHEVHCHKDTHSSNQMNMRGVFLHVMADALGSVIVMISAIIYIFTDWQYSPYVDPALSVIMVCLIMNSTWRLLTESAMILLQTVPTHIRVDSLQRRLTQEIPGVLAVHEFHVWQLAGDRIIASAHIRCHNLQDYMRIAERVKEFFHNEGIHSTTIQPEFDGLDSDAVFESTDYDNCVLDCPSTQRTRCASQTCCGAQKLSDSSAGTFIMVSGDNSLERSSP